MAKKVLIITGEASGDMHAAKLIREVHALDPNLRFQGVGGADMRATVAEIIFDIKDLALIGLFDIFWHFPKIFKVFTLIKHILHTNPPDLLILVDYPGLNLRLAKLAKKYGVKVLYYISPKLWASRQYRVKTIRQYVDKMAVIFPFEVDFYRKFGIDVDFVGNPLLDNIDLIKDVSYVYSKYNLEAKNAIVGLCPGSRKGEIKRLMPVIIETAKLLKQKFPHLQFVLPLAKSLTKEDLLLYLQNDDLKIVIIESDNYEVMRICDVLIAASGTLTLEAALLNVPMVIIYKIHLPFFLLKLIVNIPYVGLCNIIMGKKIVQELLQRHANPQEITLEVEKILTDNDYRDRMKQEMLQVRAKLDIVGKKNLAQIVLELTKVSKTKSNKSP